MGDSTVRGVFPNSLPQMYAMMSLIITEAAGMKNLTSQRKPPQHKTTQHTHPSDSAMAVKASRE